MGSGGLVRATFGGEAAFDDGERALGVGTGHRGGERHVRTEAVVARAVVEVDAHAHEPLAGAQLQRGPHLDWRGLGAALAARVLVADRVRRPAVVSPDEELGAHRSGLEHFDGHHLGCVDDRVVRRRAVVVRVAAVAALDVAVGAVDADAVGLDGERAVGGVDLDAHQPVVEHPLARRDPHEFRRRRRRRDRRGVGRSPSTAVNVRQPKPGTSGTSGDDLACRGAELADRDRGTRLAQRVQLLAGRLEVELRIARGGIVERERLDPVVAAWSARPG